MPDALTAGLILVSVLFGLAIVAAAGGFDDDFDGSC